MTDDIDRAQAREEEMRADALARFERRHPPTAEASAEQCKCCGETIPEARRQALPGVQTCVECQRDIEAQGRWDWGMGEC